MHAVSVEGASTTSEAKNKQGDEASNDSESGRELLVLEGVVFDIIVVGKGEVVAHIGVRVGIIISGLSGLELREGIGDVHIGVTFEDQLVIIEDGYLLETHVLAGGIRHIKAVEGEGCHEIVKLVPLGIKEGVRYMILRKVYLHETL